MTSGAVRGVDFGTSTSLISESTSFTPVVIPMGTVDPWIPSVLGVDAAQWVVGEDALLLPQSQVLRSVKRAITHDKPELSISNGTHRVSINADSAIRAILSNLVRTAGDNFVDLGEEHTVRLGCPAMWTGDQRLRLLKLANEAGLAAGHSTLIDEPIAAGIAWINHMLRDGHNVKGKVLVFDMGGGTLDVAVLDVAAVPGREPSISVQSSVGTAEAGDSLDEKLIEILERKYADAGLVLQSRAQGAELRSWLKPSAARAKVELGLELDVPVVVRVPGFDLPVVSLSREELDDAFRPQLDRAMDTVWWALRAALMSQVASRTQALSLTPSQARAKSIDDLAAGIDYVLIAGGMAKVPAVLRRLGQHFDGDRIYVGAGGEPSEAIVTGLGERGDYERLNLHRPGFDFILSWTEPDTGITRERVVYRAHTPLYTAQSVLDTNSAKYRWRPEADDLPDRGQGELRVQSLTGQRIGFRFEDRDGDSLPVFFGRGDFVVTLEPNGRVFFRDSFGRQKAMRVAQWPVIRGVGFEAIRMESLEDRNFKVPELVWHQKPYD
jgi:molecular chaperone DnaK (HSP70)